MPQRGDKLLQDRQAKLDRLVEQNIDPYPPRFHRSHTTKEAQRIFLDAEEAGQEGPQTTVAGRIIRMRQMGKASFVDVQDGDGLIQLFLQRDRLGDSYTLLESLDLGDFLGASGGLLRTKAGEVSIAVQQMVLLAKAIRPPPEKWHGLQDQEKRYRQRYLDLMANPEVHAMARTRARIISAMRRFLDGRGFLEVETPILVPVPAGAMAQSFATHYNALDSRVYLRIATELYLKRLMVGGIDKVYEIGRVFRNEGIDRSHNPEFTMLESYEAYADYNEVMGMVEGLVCYAAEDATGGTAINFDGVEIDLSPPWARRSLKEAIQEYSGIDLEDYPDAASLSGRLQSAGITVTYAESRGRLIDKLISTAVEPKLIQPTFLVNYPVEMSPLAKAMPDDPRYAERFEAFIAGMEIANSYTELNDPAVQRRRLEEQEELRKQYQGEELDRIDEDFLVALEHGMPPTGGLGLGVDRLVMLLTDQLSIRDVLLFPQVRPTG
jgi:lysyl-tRNA synthetase class 2